MARRLASWLPGDVAYNDVHLYLTESNMQTRREWIAALDKIGSLNPRAVIAGQKRPGNDDSPRSLKRPGSTSAISPRSRTTTTNLTEAFLQI